MIPILDIQEFFKIINKPFKIESFDIPEINFTSGNISLFETVIICLVCKNLNPKKILEFGTFNGRTTINIAANTNKEAEIITVDLPKEDIENTQYPLEGMKKEHKDNELGYIGLKDKLFNNTFHHYKEKITQLWMDSAKFSVDSYRKFFDFIFVDASHSYENALNDTYNVKQLIKDNSFILWHDYNGWPGVTKALNEFYELTYDKWNFAHIKGTSLVIYYSNNYKR